LDALLAFVLIYKIASRSNSALKKWIAKQKIPAAPKDESKMKHLPLK
jgi:hypothetical protein